MTYPDLTLAITLSTRGFAYVFFEAPETPFDWAVVEVKGSGKNEQIVERIEKLLNLYHPQILVLENIQTKSAKRSSRLQNLSLTLAHMATCMGMDVHLYDRPVIRQTFKAVGAKTKVEIAHVIAAAIPAFMHRLPPIRKIWMSEDSRQMLFDAAALVMTHYAVSSPLQEGANSGRKC